MGINMDGIYARAVACGATASKDALLQAFYQHAQTVYREAPLTPGIDTIGETLADLGYRIGIVSASPRSWIDTALQRTALRQFIGEIISLHERGDLHHKPAPDGYQEIIRVLGATPEMSTVLEDSNAGIQSAKSAGALTIGFTQNLPPKYEQRGADAYAGSFPEVVALIKG